MRKGIGYYPQIDAANINEVKTYLKRFFGKFSEKEILDNLKLIKDKKVLVIGDTIIDEYCFTLIKGRAIKDPILSVDYISSEQYAGGILAVANHISHYVDNVKLITIVGEKNDNLSFIKDNLNKNISLFHFTKPNSYTTLKKRFLDKHRNQKLFKVEYVDDYPVDKKLEASIISFLKKELPKYDLVLVGDFGHGFISDNISKTIEKYAKYHAINVQTNSANLGFNFITRYVSPDFATMDLREMQYAISDRFSEYPELIKKFMHRTGYSQFLITMGKKGCIMVNKDKVYYAPTFKATTVDTVGAGDAVFSIVSLLQYAKVNDEMLPFYTNAIGGLAVQIMGNKESVTKALLTDFIKSTYREMEAREKADR